MNMDRRQDNINRGHIYLTSLLTDEQINRLKNKSNQVRRYNFFDSSKIKVNYNQFPTLTPEEVKETLDKHGLPVDENDNVNSNGFPYEHVYLNLDPIINDIYINEIYFLKFLNNKTVNFNFSPYWIFSFNILDKYYTISKLINRGYLASDYSPTRFLKLKIIPLLKEILENNNINFRKNERKQELINLIIENNLISQSEIIPTYYLTEKGEQLIEDCNIFFINKNIGYPIFEYDLQKKEDLYYWFDIYKKKYANEKLWGFLRNLYLSFSKLKDDNYEQFLFNCFILDISGLINNGYDSFENILINNMYKQEFKDYEHLLNNSIYDELPFNYLSKPEILDILEKINKYEKKTYK